MRFSTVAATAGFAASANAAVARRTFGDLFTGSFQLPDGITLNKEDLLGPWDKPGKDEESLFHPPHHDVVIDGCDKSKDDDWHYVHNPSPGKHHSDKYKWVTETITATETVIDCKKHEPCYGGGKTVTVTIPETVTICPTPIEPPVVEPTPEPPVEPTPGPPVEPPVEPTPYPPPPVEEPPVEEPHPEPTPAPPVEPPAEPTPPSPPVEEPPVEPSPPAPPVEEPPVEPQPPVSEVPVPPPAPEPTQSEPIVYPPPPVETESVVIPPPAETSAPFPTATDDGSVIPTAAAVPNAQRAGGALLAAALAAALF